MRQWNLRRVTTEFPPTPSQPPEVVPGRVLIDQFPALLWTTDTELRFTSSLGKGWARLGLGPNQVVGTRISDVFEIDDPDLELLAAHRRALEGDSVTCWIDWGDERLLSRVGPLRDSVGQIIGALCIALPHGAEQVRKTSAA